MYFKCCTYVSSFAGFIVVQDIRTFEEKLFFGCLRDYLELLCSDYIQELDWDAGFLETGH